MTFKSLTAEQEKLLFMLLDYRDTGAMGSDAFTVFDMSTFAGARLMLNAGGKSIELVDCGIPDLLPLSDAGYITLQLIREADSFGRGDKTTWHGAVLQQGRAYRQWRRRHWSRHLISALAPSAEDVRRVIYSGAVAALLLQAWNSWLAPIAKALIEGR